MTRVENDLERMLLERPPERGAFGRLRLGAIIGGWRIEAFLGAGRSAEVYRVMSIGIGGEGALKLLVDETCGLKERFEREIEVLSSLAVDGLPRFFGAGVVGGRPYYVMEYLQPLFLPLDRAEVVPFMSSLARAVGGLHSAGYVHRDLKPGNVLRRRTGEPVLIDLGLAAPSPGGKAPGRFRAPGRFAVGTPDFAAPEQLIKGEYSERSDVFALGKMLKACCGAKVPKRFRFVVARATSADPADRYESAAKFSAALAAASAAPRYMLAAAVVLAAVAGLFLSQIRWRGVVYGERSGARPQQAQHAGARQPPPDDAAETGTARLEARPGEDEKSYFDRLLGMAKSGDRAAQTKVAEAYFHGRGVPENKTEAVKWYTLAAAAGDIAAQASLGLCLFRGWGCEEDSKAAAAWFSCAAEQGSLEAMNDIAFCYMNGRGVERDEKRGFDWAMRAAERGHATSQTMVAECYLDGRGVERDRERAEVWLHRAARQGNARARMLLRTR